MAMVEISDDQAAALAAKAAAQGLTLKNWRCQLAELETPNGSSKPRTSRYRLDDLVAQCDLNEPLTAEDRVWLEAPVVGREA